ncbi:MAG: hypothetical protein ABIE94_02355 [archaeon]
MLKQDIERTLLHKLLNLKIIGSKHTSFDNLPKGFPKHLGKEVKETAKDLIKRQLLLSKHTSYGLEVSLNPQKIDEIEQIIDEE